MPVVKPFSRLSFFNDEGPSYSRLLVSESFPSDDEVYHNDLLWRIDEKRMYKYDKRYKKWNKVNWRRIVGVSKDWNEGNLRINEDTGNLEVNSGAEEWYECIPAVGSSCIMLDTATGDTTFAYKYWVPVGQMVSVYWSFSFPIVMPPECIFDIDMSVSAGSGGLLLFVGNIGVNTAHTEFYVHDTSSSYWRSTFNGHHLCWQSYAFVKFGLNKAYTYVETTGIFKYYNTSHGLQIFSNYSYFPDDNMPYWIGVCKNSNDNSLRYVAYATVIRKF